jgi:Flp pilus assembly protein TadG
MSGLRIRRMRRGHGEPRERGAVLVEAALVIPILVMLVVGIAEFGFAYRDRLTVQTAGRTGARVGTTLGANAQSDYNILQGVKSALGSIPLAKVEKIIVYKSTTANGAVPAACLTSGSQSGSCNVYTSAALSAATTSFGCGTGALDTAWCPTTRETDQADGLDYLGVYLQVRHDFFSGFLGRREVVLKDTTVLRLEPQ